jgi:hypothetical protein
VRLLSVSHPSLFSVARHFPPNLRATRVSQKAQRQMSFSPHIFSLHIFSFPEISFPSSGICSIFPPDSPADFQQRGCEGRYWKLEKEWQSYLQTPGSHGLLGEREREREMGRWNGVGRKRWRLRAPFVGSRVEIGGLRWSERAGQCRRWVAGAVCQGSTVCWFSDGDRWPAAEVV